MGREGPRQDLGLVQERASALRAFEDRDMEMGLPGGATDAIVFRVQSEIEGKTVVSLLVVVMPMSPRV